MYLEKGLSEEVAMLALEQLSSSNIRRFLPMVKTFLKNPNRPSLEKSLLLEILKEQEVDEYLEFYLYDWYPMLEVIEDYEALATAIHYYVAMLSGIEEDDEDLCYRYGAEYAAFKKMYESVESFQ